MANLFVVSLYIYNKHIDIISVYTVSILNFDRNDECDSNVIIRINSNSIISIYYNINNYNNI